MKEPRCGIRFRAPAQSLWSSLHIFTGCWMCHCLDRGKSARLAGRHGLDREVWREPGDRCLLESSAWRGRGWEEARITNTGNEFSTTTRSPLFGPPLLYSPEAEQMLLHLRDEVKFGVKIPTLCRWHWRVELQQGVAMSVGRRCGCLVVLSSVKENGSQGKKEPF